MLLCCFWIAKNPTTKKKQKLGEKKTKTKIIFFLLKKKIIILLSLFLTGISYAQSVKVSGILKDSDNLVIETANVMAINQVTKAMDAYNITSEKGEFSLNLKPNTEYIIKAGYIGYAPFEQKITTTKENQTFNIVLSHFNFTTTCKILFCKINNILKQFNFMYFVFNTFKIY